MGMLLFVLLVILIATIGFWDTLAAVMGAALLSVLAVLIGLATVAIAGYVLLHRKRGD